jgi:hypothetical protein
VASLSTDVENVRFNEIRLDQFHRKCDFNAMLKSQEFSESSIERAAEATLRGLLEKVPTIHLSEIVEQAGPPGHKIDFVAHLSIDGRAHTLLCEAKANGQPRYVREAIHHLNFIARAFAPDATPVLVAPYLSKEAQALCTDAHVSYADLEGNCRLAFDSVFIEREVATRPASVKRELRSLFKPKSAQVLRRLLRDPFQAWRVVDLAQATDVSLGHVSNVRKALIQRDWAEAGDEGLRLTAPDDLLDAWRDNYEPPAGDRISSYTTLHGQMLSDALRQATEEPGARIALASYTAAQWLAPFARGGMDFVYVDAAGFAALRKHLEIGPIARGANLEVIHLTDQGPLLDAIEAAPGRMVTSPVQTYLDLWVSGERGREAADFLRREKLKWSS